MAREGIKRAIRMAGSQKKLADILGVSQPTVWRWLHGKKKPSIDSVKTIEKVTAGTVTCEELRPDVDWAYRSSTERNQNQ
ncbi:helix-turn-helix domain-containing protein [Pectobacterium polaris]|uniref:transcriptional regulator n=1 Tax=Pectobacterium polaris TaxID=2042057 RepID=UPI000D6157F8|nr:helix-turn-helix domain-containing protein [Pectobacterium polaris]MCU1787490.1 helix-turn-helix domain-containing protein [Pectobacterium polaris]PWD55477.1 transcriptional regulator [Pectobacterium polaris]